MVLKDFLSARGSLGPAGRSLGASFVLVLAVAVALLSVDGDRGVRLASAQESTPPCENGTVVPDPASNPGLVSDCGILLAIRDVLVGDMDTADWHPMGNWNGSTALRSWRGIRVSGTPRRVTRLELSADGLEGTLPPQLGDLAKLERLHLGWNQLTGPIPPELGNLSSLTRLILRDNQLTGSIPAELGNLAELEYLQLQDSRLVGSIPSELGSLADLIFLELKSNSLTGQIPAELGDLSDLLVLSLSGNSFTGCVPLPLKDVGIQDLGQLGLPDCPPQHTLTTSAGANGSIDPAAGEHSYDEDTSVTVTATPDAGYRIGSWGDDCSTASGTTCELTMDADRTASVTFEPATHTLAVTVTGPGGSVTPAGTTTHNSGTEVTLTASWSDATHSFTGWSGDCSGTSSTCVLTIDANKTVTATFAALAADRCSTTTAADCIRAVYRGAPDDFAQVTDIPADLLLTPNSDGRYYVERGQQYTVVTAARLPTGWTRFYLDRTPLGTPPPVSAARLIPPVGTTYTFTVTEDEAAATLITYDLKQARPFVRPRPDGKPEIGDTVVRTVFSVEADTLSYNSYDTTGSVSTPGSYAFLSDADDTSTAVTTYEALRDGTTTALLIHKSDAHGASQTALYDSVETGHLIEWHKADDCFVRYRVTDAPELGATATHREFGVRWETHVFQGCQTGSVPTSAAVTFTAAADLLLKHLGGTSLTDFAVVHGPWQFAPSAPRTVGTITQPRGDVATKPNLNPSDDLNELLRRRREFKTTDLEAARGLPAWREPAAGALPAGWAFAGALGGETNSHNYTGYLAVWSGAGGYRALDIEGIYSPDGTRSGAFVSSWTTTDGKLNVWEPLVIAGRPAWVEYSPLGAGHNALFPVRVKVYDAATKTAYLVTGLDATLLGGPTATERVIAIACSLFLSSSECATGVGAVATEANGPQGAKTRAVESPLSPPSYVLDVLSGRQPGYDTTTGALVAHNLELNCGWHAACYDYRSPQDPRGERYPDTDGPGIDIRAGAGTATYAAFKMLRQDARSALTAKVYRVVGRNDTHQGCMKVFVAVYDGTNELARLRYTHTDASLQKGDPIALPLGVQGTSAYALTEVGSILARGADPHCRDISPHLHFGRSDDFFGATLHQNRTAFKTATTTNTAKAREAAREVNLDEGILAGSGFPKGHHPDPGVRRIDPRLTAAQRNVALYAFPKFCSNTWVLKIQSPLQSAPFPIDVEPCKPAGLRAEPGHHHIALTWDDSGDPSVVGYQLRYKASTAQWPLASQGGGWKNVHVLTGLMSGGTYHVELRAVRKHYDSQGTLQRTDTTPVTVASATRVGAELMMTWLQPSLPAKAFAYATDHYELRSKQSTAQWPLGGGWATIGTASNHTLTSLTNGTLYNVEVRAVVKHGRSYEHLLDKFLRSPASTVSSRPVEPPPPILTTRVDGACGTVSATLKDDSTRAADDFVPGAIETRTWTFPYGSDVTVTARSTSTCTFKRLSEETDLTDECTTDANTYTCDVRMTEDREVTANFTRPDTYTLELSTSTLPASGPSCAAVDATPVSDSFFYLENALEWSVEQGASVTVTATVEDVRCTFVRWTGVESSAPSGADGSAMDSSATNCGGPSSCEVEMDEDRAVVAEFTYSDTAPAFAVETDSQTFQVGVEKSVQLPQATGGNGALTYSLDPVPAGLEFDSETAELARRATTPGTMVAGSTTATLTVHDADDNEEASDADTVTVTIVVKPPDTAPMFSVDTFPAPFTVNREGSVGLPVASGGNGALTYTLSPNPAWLTLAVVDGVPTISGTPTTAGTTTAELEVHDADDNRADSDSDTVMVTIKVSDEPQCTLDVVANPRAGGTVIGDWTGACGTKRTAQVTSVSDGYRFSGWSGGNCSGTNRECSDITVGTSGGPETTVTVTAHFMRQYTLTTTAGANGSIDPAPGTHTYNSGDSVLVRATPDLYYEVNAWSGDCSGRATTCELTMDSDKTAGVTFQRITYLVTATAGANGSVSGGGPYNAGTTATLTASPNTGYEVDAWSGVCSHSGTTCSFAVNGNKSAHVTFKKKTYIFTVTASGGGSASGGGPYKYGESATATATWDSVKYNFQGWSGDCSGTSASCTVTMTSNKSAHASFDKRYCYVTATAGSGGSVSGGGNVHCGVGSTTITATAGTGYCFDNWSGGLGRQRDADTTCQTTESITITKPETDLTVTANFKKKTYTFTVTASGGGSASGGGTYKHGESATATATWDSVKFTFLGWSGDCSGTSASCTVTMTSDKSAHASFEKRTCTVGVQVGTGSGTVGGGGPVQCGTSVSISATASTNYCFGNWDGLLGIAASERASVCTQSGDTSVTPRSSGVLTANFTRQSCKVTGSPSPANGGTVEGGDTVSCGTDVTLTASAASNFRHSGWSGGGCSGTSSTCTVTTTGRWGVSIPTLRVNALFTRQYTLTVNGGTGSGTYDANTWVSISAPAAQCVLGFSLIFDQWTGDSTSTSRTTRIYMSRDKTVTATYTASTTPCSLAASPDGDSEGPERGVADAPERPPLSLLVISDGATDALDLEWLGGPLNASGWQYRMRAAGAESWGDWTDIPASTGDTRAYRVSGLNGATGYRFQVRPVEGGVESTPSNATEGATQDGGASHPQIAAHHIAEGDGETQWRLHGLAFVITIPDGMRLRAGEGGQTSVTAQDMGSGSYLTLSESGAERGREILADPVRDVGALFDRIIASVVASPVEEETSDSQP